MLSSKSSTDSEKENVPLCKYCQKSFANSSNLYHHIQVIHLKESKWDCKKCGKICSSKSNLKVHYRTHIRIKPYTCKHCQYDCMHHSSIRDHLTKNHPDEPHPTIKSGYIYNSQAVPEPDEFNREKFVEQTDHSINLSFPFLPLWSFNLHYPPSIPNTIPVSSNRKSFDIDKILNLSMRDKIKTIDKI